MDLAVPHPGPRLAGQHANLELRRADCTDRRPDRVVLADRLGEAVRLAERIRASKRRLNPLAFVGADAMLEERRVDAEAGGKPLDCLASRSRLPALDLADVLLGETLSRKLGLRQARREPELPQALTEGERGTRHGRSH